MLGDIFPSAISREVPVILLSPVNLWPCVDKAQNLSLGTVFKGHLPSRGLNFRSKATIKYWVNFPLYFEADWRKSASGVPVSCEEGVILIQIQTGYLFFFHWSLSCL